MTVENPIDVAKLHLTIILWIYLAWAAISNGSTDKLFVVVTCSPFTLYHRFKYSTKVFYVVNQSSVYFGT